MIKLAKDWIKALIYALITVLVIKAFFFEVFTIPTSSMEKTLLPGDLIIVNKFVYGVRLPFTNYTISGFDDIKYEDVVVFNYPLDTNYLISNKSLYIKRCVAKPGDTLQIKNKEVFINNVKQKIPEFTEFNYNVVTSKEINRDTLLKYNITEGGKKGNLNEWQLAMTNEAKNRLESMNYVVSVNDIQVAPNSFADYIFPYYKKYNWNIDYYGKLIIPKKGMTVQLDSDNIHIYQKIIRDYEGNNLNHVNNSFLLNGDTTNTYTFKMNYYFMLGDNRHNSSDSRFWGFVPENHIIGKAQYVLFSINNSPVVGHKYRWKRIFKLIE